MISEDDARKNILRTISLLPARKVPLRSAPGCFAAQDYAARISLPVFDNSAMDGYAVLANDCRVGARLRVVGEQPAGVDRQLHLRPGQAIRIFTGAPIPAGADAVVMQEDVARHDDEIVVNADVDPGEFIRKRGCDLSEGQKILTRGERIRAATIALLASQGIGELMVGGKVSAAIISTGDELAQIGEPLQPGQIYESNSILLQALVERCGATVESIMHCRDNRDSLVDAIKKGIKEPVLIITGGVSVGEHDLVQTVLQSLGGKIDIWRVAIKPGKPFLFGRLKSTSPLATASSSVGEQSSQRSAQSRSRGGHRPQVSWESGSEAVREAPGEGIVNDCFVFGLPGNPVSAFVTFLTFVHPAILKMMGATILDPLTIPARLSVDLSNEGDRAHYIRGRFENSEFSPVGRQESHAVFGLSQANGLLRLAPGEKIKRGTIIQCQLFD